MPSGGYIAGKALTRWEADTDNIDIDYRSLEGDHRCKWLSECFSGRKGQVLRVLLVLVLFCVGLIVGYIIRRNVHEQFIAPTFRCEESSPQVIHLILLYLLKKQELVILSSDIYIFTFYDLFTVIRILSSRVDI